MNEKQIIKKIQSLKSKLDTISSMRHGSLSQQYNICGSPGCKCKRAESPEKHGPYFNLSTKINGKRTTLFIKKENVEKVQMQIENYKKFTKLMEEWMDLAGQLADIETRKN